MILLIEINPNLDSQQWRQDFDGVTYLLKFSYNYREQLYNFELSNLEGNLIASNPLVLGQILFEENSDDRLPPGKFFLADLTGESKEGTPETFGRSVGLYYQEA